MAAHPPSGGLHLCAPRLRNWSGGAQGVDRKDCWGGPADPGARAGGWSSGGGCRSWERRGGVAPWVPLSPPHTLARGRRHRAHIVPPRHPTPAGTEPHSPLARQRSWGRGAGVCTRGCACARAAPAVRVRVRVCVLGWALSGGPAPSQPCRSPQPAPGPTPLRLGLFIGVHCGDACGAGGGALGSPRG